MRRIVAKALFFLWILTVMSPSRAIAEYSLSFWDVPITMGAFAISAWGSILYQDMEAPVDKDLYDETDLLPWDKVFAGRYSEFADNFSDGLSVFALAPLVLGAGTWYNGFTNGMGFASLALMYAQALAIQNGLNLAVRSMQLWPRPYIYAKNGEGAKVSKKAQGEAYGSFFSGHSSAAFTAAVFMSEWFSEMYPNSPYKTLVWTSSLSLAGFVGALRIAAGKHYPTDVVVGAFVGAGVSLAVLKFHQNNVKNVSLCISTSYLGLNILF